jgi:NitT/TauT family transport system permease protein
MVAPSMLIYTYRGFTSAKPTAVELMSSYNASSLRVLRTLRVPSAVPHFFTQVKYATVIMLVAVVLAEIMRTGDGLGYEIEGALGQFDTPRAWAAVFTLALVGVLLYALASVVERVFFPWAARHKP